MVKWALENQDLAQLNQSLMENLNMTKEVLAWPDPLN